MKASLKILLVVTVSNLILCVLGYNKKVVFVSIIARHGARTPTWFYKNDPHQNHRLFHECGLGCLLEEGKEETYNLGLWLRRRYKHLFTDPNKIYVQTTAVDRVQKSARCCVAGIFSPREPFWSICSWCEKNKKKVDCTSNIELHTEDPKEDHILGQRVPCDAYNDEYERVHESEEMKKKNEGFKEVYDIIKRESGSTGKDGDRFQFIHKIYDIVLVEEELGLKPDDWAVNISDQMKEASILCFVIQTWTDKLKRLRMGPLLEEMIKDMKDKIDKKTELNGKLYYAHDNTIVSFLHMLGVYDMMQLPDYAACALLELVDVGDSHYNVELYYSRTKTPHPELLLSKPLDDFIASTKHLIPSDWHKECNERSLNPVEVKEHHFPYDESDSTTQESENTDNTHQESENK